MIATCPACDKRYRLADDAVPPGGRTLRCAVCGHGWTVLPDASPAAPEAPLLPFALPDAAPPVAPRAAASHQRVESVALPDVADDVAEPAPRRTWPIVLVLAVIALAALAVVEFAPATTFDPPRLGLPPVALTGIDMPTLPPLDLTRIPVIGDRLDALVNPPPAPASPLRITATGERHRLTNGTWLMTVTGSVTNPTPTPVALIGIDAALLDSAGHVAFRWRIAAPASIVAAGGSAAFESVAANFPPAATVLRVTVR